MPGKKTAVGTLLALGAVVGAGLVVTKKAGLIGGGGSEALPMAFGPIQIITVGFPSTEEFEGRIAEELIKLSDTGVIRIVDALAVAIEDDELTIVRATDLSEEQREQMGAEFGALIGLGADGIDGFIAGAELGAEIAAEGGLGLVEEIGAQFVEELPEGEAALLLIIEHVWAVPLRDAIVAAGGVLLANEWIGAQDLVALGAALREEAEAGS